jgi:hypothetical protein
MEAARVAGLFHADVWNSFLILKIVGQVVLACAARIQLAQNFIQHAR